MRLAKDYGGLNAYWHRQGDPWYRKDMSAVMIMGSQFIQAEAASRRELIQALD